MVSMRDQKMNEFRLFLDDFDHFTIAILPAGRTHPVRQLLLMTVRALAQHAALQRVVRPAS
jgi:hypothetical protein